MTVSLKAEIRQHMKQLRSQLTVPYRLEAAQQIGEQLVNLEQYGHAKHIAFYSAVHGEVDLSLLWRQADSQGKCCYFPVLQQQGSLLFLPASPSTVFKKNHYGILEPTSDLALALPVRELDIMVLPVVAFDAQGTRLGMGAGYYDRTLAQETTCLLLGVAYAFQQVDSLCRESWDVPMDVVITPQSTYWCKKSNEVIFK